MFKRNSESLGQQGLPAQRGLPEQQGALERQGLDDAELPTLAVASIEHLFHYRCGVEDCGLWWAIADIQPPETIVCPHCGSTQRVPQVLDGQKRAWNGQI